MKLHVPVTYESRVALCGQANATVVCDAEWLILTEKQQCKRCKRQRKKRAQGKSDG